MTLKPGMYFMSGNEAIAEGAIMAGCRFFAGYPITPSSEIAERLARRLPQVGGIFIQMEDELASMIAIVGASWGGLKAMTATSGPGFSLMQENLGFAVMTETPVVVVDVQRGSPSTGLPTLIGQGDIMQAKWGSHGPYEIIALSPSTVQECFDFAIKAFNLSEKYRVPVIVLMDERISHLYEKVVVPPKEKLILVERKRPKSKKNFLPYKAEEDLIPPMPPVGEGYHFHITGLTHDERGYPKIDAETHEKLVRRLSDKIRIHADEIIHIDEIMMDDAEIAIVAFGSVVRPARYAIKYARKKGIKVGLIKLSTIWPFPDKMFQKYADRIKAFVVAEINYGQISREVKRCVGDRAKVHLVPKMGGAIHTPEEILNAILEVK
ncbi:MAG: 2-oxoacid:acceptor oxidoreductase subunit alpha [Candidatus Njordarchaeum guaymaensis]